MFVCVYIYIYIYVCVCVCVCVLVCFQLDAFVREHVGHNTYLMGYSMRLELTCVCSLNGFYLLFVFFMKAGPSFFLVCVSLSLLFPSFTFDI